MDARETDLARMSVIRFFGGGMFSIVYLDFTLHL